MKTTGKSYESLQWDQTLDHLSSGPHVSRVTLPNWSQTQSLRPHCVDKSFKWHLQHTSRHPDNRSDVTLEGQDLETLCPHTYTHRSTNPHLPRSITVTSTSTLDGVGGQFVTWDCHNIIVFLVVDHRNREGQTKSWSRFFRCGTVSVTLRWQGNPSQLFSSTNYTGDSSHRGLQRVTVLPQSFFPTSWRTGIGRWVVSTRRSTETRYLHGGNGDSRRLSWLLSKEIYETEVFH